MLKIPFYKYQGTGNDFVLIDNRAKSYLNRSDVDQIRMICDRKFGVGADGLILLQEKRDYDFEMVYFNADGREGSMCGNGGRCISAFAHFLGIVTARCRFWAIDGEHESNISNGNWVELKMSDVRDAEAGEQFYIMDTGSPHYVIFVEDLDDINVVESGQVIRYSDRFKTEGINVNFVEQSAEGLLVATYERGVEGETLSCGTGATAAALAFYYQKKLSAEPHEVPISTKGGKLKVRFRPNAGKGFSDIWLCGPAQQVFSGEYLLYDSQ